MLVVKSWVFSNPILIVYFQQTILNQYFDVTQFGDPKEDTDLVKLEDIPDEEKTQAQHQREMDLWNAKSTLLFTPLIPHLIV